MKCSCTLPRSARTAVLVKAYRCSRTGRVFVAVNGNELFGQVRLKCPIRSTQCREFSPQLPASNPEALTNNWKAVKTIESAHATRTPEWGPHSLCLSIHSTAGPLLLSLCCEHLHSRVGRFTCYLVTGAALKLLSLRDSWHPVPNIGKTPRRERPAAQAATSVPSAVDKFHFKYDCFDCVYFVVEKRQTSEVFESSASGAVFLARIASLCHFS